MERSWRQVLAFLVLLALFAAACSSDPTEVVVGDDTLGETVDEADDAMEDDEAMEEVADVARDSVGVDSAPVELSANQAELLEANAAAAERWEAADIIDYDMTLRVNGFIDDSFPDSVQVEVRNGEVTRGLPEDFTEDDMTISALFEIFAEGIEEEEFESIDYDEETGRPTRFAGFENGQAVSIDITNFRTPDEYPKPCSAGDSGEIENPGDPLLNDAQQETRSQLIQALISCDFLLLTHLADTGAEPLTTSFGGGGVELLWQAEANGEPLMTTLLELLLSEATINSDDGFAIWPAEFADPNSDYLDWRVGISDEGEWLYFISGD